MNPAGVGSVLARAASRPSKNTNWIGNADDRAGAGGSLNVVAELGTSVLLGTALLVLGGALGLRRRPEWPSAGSSQDQAYILGPDGT